MVGFVFFVFWVIGVIFGVQLIAAWYSVIDFRYRIKRYWGTVVMRISAWTALAVLVCYALPVLPQIAFFEGIKFIFFVHLLFILFPNLIFYGFRKKQKKMYADFLK